MISQEEYRLTNWIDDDFRLRKSPIQEEADRQYEMIRPSLSWFSCYDICQTCGGRSNVGLYECMTGRFKCVDCVKGQIIARLEADMDWQKRERLFNLRRAREKHKIDSDAQKSVNDAIRREEEITL